MPTKTAAAALPKLTDHPGFASVAAKMLELEVAFATARRTAHRLAEACRAGDAGGRFEPSDSAVSRSEQAGRAADATKEARDAFARATYDPARGAAVAAVAPKLLADVWGPALRAVLATFEAAVIELAKAAALRTELEHADLFHLPLTDALPAADLFGDPADAWSPIGKLMAAVRGLDAPPASG